METFQNGFFHFIICIYISSRSLHFSIALFFLVLNNIHCLKITVYLPIHLLKNMLIPSKFCELWIKLLATSLHRFLCDHVLWTPFKNTRRMIIGSPGKSVVSFIRNYQANTQRVCSILHSLRQCRGVSVVPHSPSTWICPCFEFCPLNICIVVLHFNLHSPDGMWCGVSFHIFTCHLHIFVY